MNAPANAKHITAHQNDLKTGNVIAGNAIFEAARSARIGSNVSANGAMFEACRIGWIKQFLLAGRAFQLSRNHSGLNDCNCIVKTYFSDSIHPRERERDPLPNWDATADIAIPGSAPGYRNLILVSKS